MPETRTVRTYCRTCLAACGVLVEVAGEGDGERVVRVEGDPDHPLSRGYSCPKGRAMGALQHHPDRLDRPMRRRSRGDGLEAVSWDVLLADLAEGLSALREASGPGAIGLYTGTGGGYDSLGSFVAGALSARLPLPSTYSAMTIDTPCLPLVSSLMCGSMIPNPVLDLEEAGLTLMLGTNPTASHGHTTAWPSPTAMLRRLTAEGRELWVADPRATRTARSATRHLALRPASDHALLAHLVRAVLGPGGGADRAYLAAHAEGALRLAAAVDPWDEERTCAETGLEASDLRDLVAAIRRFGRIAVLTGTGCSMQRNANAIEWLAWALQVVTHSFEQPGGQWFHPGATRRLDALPAFPEPAFQDAPATPLRPEVPRHVGQMPCSVMLDEIEAGRLRGLLVLGGDPLTAFPNTPRVRAAMQRLEVLAVVDIVATPLADLATHLLPATAPLERHDVPGYMESAQTAVVAQLATPVLASSGERRPMWWMLARLGEALGVSLLPGGVSADAMEEEALLRAVVADGRVGLDAMRETSAVVLDEARPALRGWVEEKLPGGRWRLAPPELVAQLAAIARDEGAVGGELRVISGRQLRKMNSALRDTPAPGERVAEARIHLSPQDAAAARVEEGATVRLTSTAGRLEGAARVDAALRPGTVWVPHGWPELPIGRLTSERDGVDPLTGMVVQSGIAVRLERVEGEVERAAS